MTEIAPAAHQVPRLDGGGRQKWSAFLAGELTALWRPDEWVGEVWRFVGDPTNPRTALWQCSEASCTQLSYAKKGMCQACNKVWQTTHDIDQVRQRAAQRTAPDRVGIGTVRNQCKVERDGERCQRSSTSFGYCAAHTSQWSGTYKPKGVSRHEFFSRATAKPLPPKPGCRVVGCDRASQWSEGQLCEPHKSAYRKSAAQSIDKYLRHAAPVPMTGTFSLMPLPETLRWELLYALQQDDARGQRLDPQVIVTLITRLNGTRSFLQPGVEQRLVKTNRQAGLGAIAVRFVSYVRGADARFRGKNPLDEDVWDTFAAGIPTEADHSGRRQQKTGAYMSKRKLADFRSIRQPWLRELVKTWARETPVHTTALLQAITAFTYVSTALSIRADSDDPSTAGREDINNAFRNIRYAKTRSGELYSSNTRSSMLSIVRTVLLYLRTSGHMDAVPTRFALNGKHTIPKTDQALPEHRYIPKSVIKQISRAISSWSPGQPGAGGLLPPKLDKLAKQTALTIMVDTGRRRSEIVNLRIGCVTSRPASGTPEYTLRYDNIKGKRPGRTIPILTETAHAILEWEQELKNLDLGDDYGNWLFPAPYSSGAGAAHLSPASLGRYAVQLVEHARPLYSSEPDFVNGGYKTFDSRIVTHDFRHAYAQRLADSGVATDVLRKLMDHKSMSTTQRYYVVSEKRRREAVNAVSPLIRNNHGDTIGTPDAQQYALSTVAVPFGGCAEPQNVRAGGSQCPIRFQCTGCSFYRVDPSYLPALEDFLAEARSDLEMMKIVDFGPGFADQKATEVKQVEEIVVRIRRDLEELTLDKRAEVEEASVTLRRLRAQRPMIPLAVK